MTRDVPPVRVTTVPGLAILPYCAKNRLAAGLIKSGKGLGMVGSGKSGDSQNSDSSAVMWFVNPGPVSP